MIHLKLREVEGATCHPCQVSGGAWGNRRPEEKLSSWEVRCWIDFRC